MVDILNNKDKEKKVTEIIDRLLKNKGIEKYDFSNRVEEASKQLPGGIYPESGTIVTKEGKIYDYWLDWDEIKQDYTLGDNRTYKGENGVKYSFFREVQLSEYNRPEDQKEVKEIIKRLNSGDQL